MRFTVIPSPMNIMNRSPVGMPVTEWPYAPTAISAIPSPSRSPMRATDEPNRSPSRSAGPFAVSEFISTVLFTVPSVFISKTYRSPDATPLTGCPGAPTTKSLTKSPSRSPTYAMEEPNRSPSRSAGPFAVSEFISIVLFTVLSEFIRIKKMLPEETPAVSRPGAPTAKSLTKSPSRSPTYAMEEPNRSPSRSAGPFAVSEFISIVRFTVLSEFIMMTYMLPVSAPPIVRLGAPAAMSNMPLPSRSPKPATEAPNRAGSYKTGPSMVFALISVVAMRGT